MVSDKQDEMEMLMIVVVVVVVRGWFGRHIAGEGVQGNDIHHNHNNRVRCMLNGIVLAVHSPQLCCISIYELMAYRNAAHAMLYKCYLQCALAIAQNALSMREIYAMIVWAVCAVCERMS